MYEHLDKMELTDELAVARHLIRKLVKKVEFLDRQLQKVGDPERREGWIDQDDEIEGARMFLRGGGQGQHFSEKSEYDCWRDRGGMPAKAWRAMQERAK
jgi:hypothetical protein